MSTVLCYISYSHTAPSAIATGPASQTASSVIESVAGVTDWDFLCTEEEARGSSGHEGPGRDEGEEGERQRIVGKRPSLDDFDGEIAVFQVSIIYIHVHVKVCCVCICKF